MMLKERLKIAERNAERCRIVAARFAHVVAAAQAFVEKQEPLGQHGLAASEFNELVLAVRRLLPPRVPEDGEGPG